jgi:hypothetical protein
MSRTLKTYVCFGVLLENTEQLPWNHAKYEYYINDWWIDSVCGFKPSTELFDSNREYINKYSTYEQVQTYIEERKKFIREHLLPVELITYGYSEDELGMILSHKDLIYQTWYDTPIKLNNTMFDFKTIPPQSVSITKFCEDHNIKYKEEPAWYTVSYSD